MYRIRNKWNKQICKWIAIVLGIVLLANQFNMTISASEQIGVDILTESGDIAGEENNAESSEVDEGEEKTEPGKDDQAEENGEDGAKENEGEAGGGSENDDSGEGDVGEHGTISENTTEGSSETYTGSMRVIVENGSEEDASDSSESAGEGEIVVSRTADVVFVIDVSSSMGSYINKVKERIADFINSLNEADVNVRIKFVLFSDITESGEATVCSAWCSTVEEATAALNSIKMLGGGDTPETPLDGMGFMFQDDFGWRESVAKFSILLTDAPYKLDNTFGYTVDGIAEELDKNDIVSSIIVPKNYVIYDGWVENGGKKADIASDYSFLLDWVGEVILPGVGVEVHKVTIEVKKDTTPWSGHGKNFILQNLDKGSYVKNSKTVEDGNYRIYEVTASSGYLDTGEEITVAGEDKTAEVYYYTVTFCDGDNEYDSASEQAPQIVLKGQTASRPNPPTKPGYSFDEWVTEKNGTTPFDFSQEIGVTTHVYAGWISDTYSVDIKVQKDDVDWEGHERTFYLKKKDTDVSMNDLAAAGAGNYMLDENDATDTWITNLSAVEAGTYDIYDATNSDAIVDTGVTVTVSNNNSEATINYYTVTFYNDATVFDTQIVLSGTTVNEPSDRPTKEGYTFYRWTLDKDDSSNGFSFGTLIIGTTNLYASWTKDPDIMYTITVSEAAGGSISPNGAVQVKAGDNQQFVITPDEGYKITSILVDGGAVEPDVTANTTEDSNIKKYTFENVIENHTLTASFEPFSTQESESSKSSGGSSIAEPDTNVIIEEIVNEAAVPSSKNSEPKTGDTSYVEIYVTIGMIAGLSYLFLYFADGECGMTEEQKKEIVAALVKWARKGTRIRKYVALALIFAILVYYHSIGKRTTVEWKELYE